MPNEIYALLATSQTVLIVKHQLTKKKKVTDLYFLYLKHSDSHFREDSWSYILTTQDEINASLYNPGRFGSVQWWLGTRAKH